MFSFKKSKNIEFTEPTRENFLIILTKIEKILTNADLSAQAQVASTLINSLNQRNSEEFVRLLNGIDMWGGSGAVWEVYIKDNNEAKKFEEKIIELIDLMEQANVLGKGIKPIRKLFKKNRELD